MRQNAPGTSITCSGPGLFWPGVKEVDPRYAFRSETLRQWLGTELIVPELWPDLRALAPKEVIHERKLDHWKKREETRDRVAEGRYQRKRDDFEAMATDRRSEALKLREEGLSWKEVGERLGLSEGAAKKLGYRAKARNRNP